jgi:hypothetical protein
LLRLSHLASAEPSSVVERISGFWLPVEVDMVRLRARRVMGLGRRARVAGRRRGIGGRRW